MEPDGRYSGFVIKHFGFNHGHELLKKRLKPLTVIQNFTWRINPAYPNDLKESEILSIGGNNSDNNTKYV